MFLIALGYLFMDTFFGVIEPRQNQKETNSKKKRKKEFHWDVGEEK